MLDPAERAVVRVAGKRGPSEWGGRVQGKSGPLAGGEWWRGPPQGILTSQLESASAFLLLER